MRVLVTGAAGRIGSSVSSALAEAGYSVVGMDWHTPSVKDESVFEEFISADVADASAVAVGCRDIVGVVHLAGIASPLGHPAVRVFGNNVLATFTVLEQAAQCGARAAIVASSMSALGFSWASDWVSPIYVPIDEAHPLRPSDPYGLAKQCDEQIAAMFSRRSEIAILAYRFPFTESAELIEERAQRNLDDPGEGARDLWGYLDVRDAADACVVGLERMIACEGVWHYEALNIVADDSLADESIDELIRRYHPTTRVTESIPPRGCAYSVARAECVLGFRARYLRGGGNGRR